jgi:hypothetical protein
MPTGVTGNETFPDTFDFKQITTGPTTADSRLVLDCEGTTYLTGQIFGDAKGGEDWTVIVVTDPAPAQLEKFLADEPGLQGADGLWLI